MRILDQELYETLSDIDDAYDLDRFTVAKIGQSGIRSKLDFLYSAMVTRIYNHISRNEEYLSNIKDQMFHTKDEYENYIVKLMQDDLLGKVHELVDQYGVGSEQSICVAKLLTSNEFCKCLYSALVEFYKQYTEII